MSEYEERVERDTVSYEENRRAEDESEELTY